MALTKHHSSAGLPAHRVPSGDPENLRRVLSWSALCRRLSGVTLRPGVTRYRTIEEADAAGTAEQRIDRQG